MKLRTLFIILFSGLLVSSLTACSKEESAGAKDVKQLSQSGKQKHGEHEGHDDNEHHGSAKKDDHDEHEGHDDNEHHDSAKKDDHDEHEGHDDNEHHNSAKKDDHDEHEGHDDNEHHGSAKKDDHDEHGEEGHGEHEEASAVHLTAEQMKTANITVAALELSDARITIRAPGEVKLNAYKTIKVSPRINAQVIARHAVLGEEVKAGQSLVTLSSVEMAETQGQLLLADKEWQRVKKLGRKVVSARRYITAKVNYEKAYANATAYGMGEAEIKSLLAQKRSADGSFKLVAQQAGRILHDKFIVGERVEAGYELMVITDESSMWVEARVTPQVTSMVDVGNSAEVVLGDQRHPAKVIQLHHSLDETTRTSAVRLEVKNVDDHLHAGMFVTAFIETRNTRKALQVPEEAVLRSSDGDWQIMVEQDEAGEFKGVEVELKSVSNGMATIVSKVRNKNAEDYIGVGTRVVTHGAFFVQSELAKGGFEIHNH